MRFFIEMNPPTVTAQMKKVRVVHGRPMFYEPKNVKEARIMLRDNLALHRPPEPMSGALSLSTLWLFPKGKSHKHGEWRVTRPDTDNLQKMLKDCMTDVGFWKNDAQVAMETIEKRWADDPCGIYIELDRLEVKDSVRK